MSNKIASRLRSSANLLFFCFNVVACGLLLATLVSTRWSKVPIAATAQNDAELLGMDVYVARDPFALFINKDFASDKAFMLARYGGPAELAISEQLDTPVEKEDRSVTKRVLSVDLVNSDFSMNCRYYVHSQTGKVEVAEFGVYRDDRAFFDLNADGAFDSLVTTGNNGNGTVHVAYQGEWREVDPALPQDRHHKRLLGGEAVVFDADQGDWKPSSGADKPVQGESQ